MAVRARGSHLWQTVLLAASLAGATHGQPVAHGQTPTHVEPVAPARAYTVSTVAGSAANPNDNQWATKATLKTAYGIAFDDSGALLVADMAGNRIWRAGPDGRMTVIAGTGEPGSGGDGGPALAARFDWPVGMAFDAAGRLYIADRNNHRVRMLTPVGE